MLPHQQRVVDERKELDTKITSLAEFIAISPQYQKLGETEQVLLYTQGLAMTTYLEILDKRIAAFPQEGGSATL